MGTVRQPAQLTLPTIWKPMSSAPRDASWIIARVENSQRIVRVHFAEDLSGSEQPAFSGWFIDCGSYFDEAPHLEAWMGEDEYKQLIGEEVIKRAEEIRGSFMHTHMIFALTQVDPKWTPQMYGVFNDYDQQDIEALTWLWFQPNHGVKS